MSSKCEDGSVPIGLTYAGQQDGSLYDGVSPLYGETVVGNKGTRGVAYSLTPDGHGGWTQKPLYIFCSQGHDLCTDGLYPNGDLIMNASGNLFGTTQAGGAQNSGLVFKLAPGNTMWAETVLHDFCSDANCADGKQPWYQSMTMADDDTIYGTTTLGGNKSGPCQADGCGVVYKIASDGTESTLYAFCNVDHCIDGEAPTTGLTIDATGMIYGTTDYGGAHWDRYGGTVFRIGSEGSLKTLFSFCDFSTSCKYGRDPGGDLLLDTAGNIFGLMTNSGYKGTQQGEGTVFELSP
jgi:uncharacterized repeat protein (TIGR03803 family)